MAEGVSNGQYEEILKNQAMIITQLNAVSKDITKLLHGAAATTNGVQTLARVTGAVLNQKDAWQVCLFFFFLFSKNQSELI